MSVADKCQFPLDDCPSNLKEIVDCYTCIYAKSIEGGTETDYCTKKEKFVDYQKPCKEYYSKDMYKLRLGLP